MLMIMLLLMMMMMLMMILMMMMLVMMMMTMMMMMMMMMMMINRLDCGAAGGWWVARLTGLEFQLALPPFLPLLSYHLLHLLTIICPLPLQYLAHSTFMQLRTNPKRGL